MKTTQAHFVWMCEDVNWRANDLCLNNRKNNRIDVFPPPFFPNMDEDGCFIHLYPPYAALNVCPKRCLSLSQTNTLRHYIIYIKIIPKVSVCMDFLKVNSFFSTTQNFEWPVSFSLLYFAAQKQAFQKIKIMQVTEVKCVFMF